MTLPKKLTEKKRQPKKKERKRTEKGINWTEFYRASKQVITQCILLVLMLLVSKCYPSFFPHVPRLLYAYPFIVLVPKAVWHTFKTDDRLDITEQTAVDFHWKFTENDWKITGDDSASICKILLQFTHHKVRENCKHDGILVQVFRRFLSTWRLESRAQQIRAITPVSILHKVGVPIISAEQPLGIVQVPVGSQVLPD